MAERPVFCPGIEAREMVREILIRFDWTPGMAASQKQKNIIALHEAAARDQSLRPLLEISTKSPERLGRQLSAFNLKVETGQAELGAITMESAYQGSKVFEGGGPYQDLYGGDSLGAKKDRRLTESGHLTGFRYFDEDWGLLPKTAFYDWLYVSALANHREDLEALDDYEGFTDIEFNPKTSLNCQARACALYVGLIRRGLLDQALESQRSFIELASSQEDGRLSDASKQLSLDLGS